MSKEIFLITGGTNGIGFHAAQEIAKAKKTVIITGKNALKGKNKLNEIRKNTGNEDVHFINGDLSSQIEIKSIAEFVKRKFSNIDVLINNAGATFFKREESVDGIEKTFAINHLAYFLLTGLLLPVILDSHKPRIVNVASSVHKGMDLNFDDIEMKKTYDGYRAYRQSKLCNILFTYFLSNKLKSKEVTVNCLHPGFVNTGLGHNNSGTVKFFFMLSQKLFGKSPQEGAETSIYLAMKKDLEKVNGKYFHKHETLTSSGQTYNQDTQKKLWDLSEKYTNFSYLEI